MGAESQRPSGAAQHVWADGPVGQVLGRLLCFSGLAASQVGVWKDYESLPLICHVSGILIAVWSLLCFKSMLETANL